MCLVARVKCARSQLHRGTPRRFGTPVTTRATHYNSVRRINAGNRADLQGCNHMVPRPKRRAKSFPCHRRGGGQAETRRVSWPEREAGAAARRHGRAGVRARARGGRAARARRLLGLRAHRGSAPADSRDTKGGACVLRVPRRDPGAQPCDEIPAPRAAGEPRRQALGRRLEPLSAQPGRYRLLQNPTTRALAERPSTARSRP